MVLRVARESIGQQSVGLPQASEKVKMTNRRNWLRTTCIAVVFAVTAAACGGDDSDSAADPEPAERSVATTAPLDLGSEEETTVDAPGDGDGTAEANPHESIVLLANADLYSIPTFRAPTGRAEDQITIYDVNAIDGIEREYPLNVRTHYENRLALLVKQYDDSRNWAEVYLPVRPNGSTAWVQSAFFEEMRHDYHITVDLSTNNVMVYKGDELLKTQLAVSGKVDAPTPVVSSYIDEKIAGDRVSPAYGSWILSIAAFSTALATFGENGNMPKLALHGTNAPELMGQYVSFGCVRVPNDVIEFIADTVPVGTPVDIIRT